MRLAVVGACLAQLCLAADPPREFLPLMKPQAPYIKPKADPPIERAIQSVDCTGCKNTARRVSPWNIHPPGVVPWVGVIAHSHVIHSPRIWPILPPRTSGLEADDRWRLAGVSLLAPHAISFVFANRLFPSPVRLQAIDEMANGIYQMRKELSETECDEHLSENRGMPKGYSEHVSLPHRSSADSSHGQSLTHTMPANRSPSLFTATTTTTTVPCRAGEA